MKLREIMTAPVLTVTPIEPASDALARMRDAGIRHAVVVAGGAPTVVGIVSERDLGGPRGGGARKHRTIGELMQTELVIGSPELSVAEAVALVRQYRIGCIPILDGAELVGIVTRGDLLAALARRRRDHREARGPAEPPRPPLDVSPNRDKWS
jgi:CBS domain-containing protein